MVKSTLTPKWTLQKSRITLVLRQNFPHKLNWKATKVSHNLHKGLTQDGKDTILGVHQCSSCSGPGLGAHQQQTKLTHHDFMCSNKQQLDSRQQPMDFTSQDCLFGSFVENRFHGNVNDTFSQSDHCCAFVFCGRSIIKLTAVHQLSLETIFASNIGNELIRTQMQLWNNDMI